MNKTADTDAIILACWPAADPLLRQLEADPALIDMGGKPVLQRVLEKLIDIGCRRIAVVHGNQPQRAEALLGDGERWGCRIAHYYAAEGDSPLSLLTRLVPADDRNCVLAAADTVALASLDLNEASVACCLESGQLRWSGWAVLPPKMIRWIAKTVRNRGDLEAGLDLTQSRLVMTTTISTASVATTLASLPRLFDRSPGAEGISRRPRAQGIWIGNGSQVHPTARLRPPVFVGQNVLIAEGAQVGPNATIGDGCFIDAGSRIEESMLLANTYVGQKLDVVRAVLAGNTLLNSGLGVALQIPDAELLRDTDGRDQGVPRATLTQRALAVMLWLALAPLGAIWWLRSGGSAERVAAGIGVPSTIAGAYRSSKVRFAMSHDAVHAQSEGAWAGHFLATFLPGLTDAISGRVALVGLQPRTAQEILSLPCYWQRLYRIAPAGLVGEALLQDAEDTSAEMSYAGDALSAGPMPFSRVLSVLLRYASRVMTEMLARKPRHLRTPCKPGSEAVV
ncbi:MAG: NTP transferase domain-containing protein [Proteobacteria bacterium]|nr:NTP transferase domain-containing protein [Pseudomonadota bacterium]